MRSNRTKPATSVTRITSICTFDLTLIYSLTPKFDRSNLSASEAARHLLAPIHDQAQRPRSDCPGSLAVCAQTACVPHPPMETAASPAAYTEKFDSRFMP